MAYNVGFSAQKSKKGMFTFVQNDVIIICEKNYINKVSCDVKVT